MFGNRGDLPQGLERRSSERKTPWIMVGGELPAFDDDVWEPCPTGTATTARPAIWTAEHPEMLAKLQRLWIIEATKYNVLPIDDRTKRIDYEPRHRGTLQPEA